MSLLVTLTIYPAVQVYITSLSDNSTWRDVYFQPTVTYLLFNIGDVTGRELPRWIRWVIIKYFTWLRRVFNKPVNNKLFSTSLYARYHDILCYFFINNYLNIELKFIQFKIIIDNKVLLLIYVAWSPWMAAADPVLQSSCVHYSHNAVLRRE